MVSLDQRAVRLSYSLLDLIIIKSSLYHIPFEEEGGEERHNWVFNDVQIEAASVGMNTNHVCPLLNYY